MAKKIEFTAPEGFVLPEGKAIDEDIELMATVRMKKDGKLCLVELDGVRMPGYRDDEDDGKTYANAAGDAMDEGE